MTKIQNLCEFKTQQLAQKRGKYIQLLRKSLGESVEKMVQTMKGQVKKISLFGSYPERVDLFSDLDLLIVMESEKPFIERLKEIYSLLNLPVDADILCYTPEEVNKLKQFGFLRHVLKKEIVLYEEKSQRRRKKVARASSRRP